MRKIKAKSCIKKMVSLICVISMLMLNYERGYAMDKDMEYLKEMLEEGTEKSSAKQYEMNIVLERLAIKRWQRMPYALDDIEWMEEIGEEPDEPLGEYSPEKLKEYTDEDIQVEFEYCYGYHGKKDDFAQLIQIVCIYVDGELYTMDYYCRMSYGAIMSEGHHTLNASKREARLRENENYGK